MNHQRYVVKKGDCLWDLSERFLGSPWEWQRIYTYNNREDIVQRTGRGIDDPDLIYVKQVLYLPVLPGRLMPPPKRWHIKKQPKSLKNEITKITVPFTLAYRLDELPLMIYEDALLKATIKLAGKVAIRLADSVPLMHATNRGLEATYSMQTEKVLNQLFDETKVLWDKQTNQITYRSMMVSNSSTPQVPSTALGLVVSSDKPVPVLRGEILFPKLSGYIKRHFYTAMDVRVVIELEPKIPPVAKGPTRKFTDPALVRQPSGIHRSQDYTAAWWLLGTGALILAGAILTDFIPGGQADDIAIPAALSMMKYGEAVLTFPVIVRSVAGFAARAAAFTSLNAAHVH